MKRLFAHWTNEKPSSVCAHTYANIIQNQMPVLHFYFFNAPCYFPKAEFQEPVSWAEISSFALVSLDSECSVSAGTCDCFCL